MEKYKRIEQERKEFEAIFSLARIEVQKIYLLENGYWPDHPDYYNVRTPWYLFKTHRGMIKIGNRKRVISIDWEDTDIRKIVTTDKVTKSEKYAHAWTVDKALEYVKNLFKESYKNISE